MNAVLELVPQEKVCKACLQAKPVAEFHHYSAGRPSNKCKPCHTEDERKRQKALWASNPEYRERHNQAGKNYRRGIRTEKFPATIKGNEKICRACGSVKLMNEFPLRGNHRLNTCAVCYNEAEALKSRTRYRENPEYRGRALAKSRRSHLKHHYGITTQQADEMLSNQHGLCANRACGLEISFHAPIGSGKLAVIDHDHKKGKVRGILCSGCNVSLGHLEKDKNKILGLMEYAEKHNKGD